MKKILLLLTLLFASFAFSQTSGITYQAIVYSPTGEPIPGYNNANAPLANRNVCLLFTISDANSQIEYQEKITITTDEFGMVNTIIGSGDQTDGYATSFSGINWSVAPKSLKVALDTNGQCFNFIEISNQPFSYVPFAFAANSAANVTGIVPIANGGTNATTVVGAKTNLGLENVDNTSDLNKPVSIATQTVLNLKENAANKSTDATLSDVANVKFPTELAVKTYVNGQISTANSTLNASIAAVQADVNQNELDSDAVDATLQNNINTINTTVAANATAANSAIALKENAANKSTDVTLTDVTNTKFPTELAVKTFVNGQITTVNASNTALQATVAANAAAANTAIAAVQADVNQNELDSDAVDATLQTNINTLNTTVAANATAANTAIAAVQADVNQNELDSDAVDATLQTNINTLNTTVAANATAANTAIAAVQADVNQNELDSDAVDVTLQTNINALNTTVAANATAANTAIAAVQADVNQNELDSDAVDATLQTNINVLNTTVAANAAAANTAIAAVQADVNQNELDSDAVDVTLQTNINALNTTVAANATAANTAIAAVQADVNQNELDSDAVDTTLQNNINTLNTTVAANATAANTAIALKENAANKSTDITLSDTTNLKFPTELAVKTYVNGQIVSATIADADTTTKGKIQLAGDLGGTAAAPTVPGLVNKENIANKSTDITLSDVTNVKFPTELAVKTYVNGQIALATIVDADTTTKGKIQLAGDLGGTAAAPTVPGLVNKENIANKSTDVTLSDVTNVKFPTELAVKTYVNNQVSNGIATNVSGVVAIANGGTGSATQNFVDLSTDQTISGAKTFTTNGTYSAALTVSGNLVAPNIGSSSVVDFTHRIVSAATTSTFTKLIQFGTGGLAGSNTIINIGSGISGANNAITIGGASSSSTTSTTVNGIVILPALSAEGIVTNNANGVLNTTPILPVVNGGTGATTQNFVDLTTDQTITGDKNFTGTIGIGTSTNYGNSKLHIDGNGLVVWGGTGSLLDASGNSHGYNENVALTVDGKANNDILQLRNSSPNTLLVVDKDGNMGIGNTAPTEKLEVTGNIKTSGSYTGNGFKTPSGTSSQYLMADGSVDSNSYLILNSQNPVAIGYVAGTGGQAANAIAIGNNAAQGPQATGAIGIGIAAAQYNQGENSIAIGAFAGNNGQHANSIVLNATGNALHGSANSGLYIDPIRSASGSSSLFYDTTTKEVTYGSTPAVSLTSSVTGILPIANGGTGSATQNFVDLSTTQSIGGAKTFTGAVSGITNAMIGLGNVDNTSDVTKPISSDTQTALNFKADIASPTFAGTPNAPTAASGTNTTQIATTAFVTNAVSGAASSIVGYTSAPGGQNQGFNNIGIGPSTALTSFGSCNTSVGASAMQSNTSGQFNTAIGYRALSAISVAGSDSNVAIGYAAGYYYGTGWDNNNQKTYESLYIGGMSRASAINQRNEIVIGYNAIGNGSNTIRLGNTAITNTKTSGTITAGVVTYPNTDGTSGQVLVTNGSGTIAWGTPAANVREVADEFTATVSQTSFTLTQTKSANSKVKMYINGIRISNTAYSISGTTLTYVPANNGTYTLTAGDRIQFDYFY